MGECEAYYRILPSLHLKDSNIKCVFVTSGYPENRNKFLTKMNQEEVADSDAINAVTVKNREGKFKEQLTVHTYYACRPISIEDICLAQFASHYTMSNSKPKKETTKDKHLMA